MTLFALNNQSSKINILQKISRYTLNQFGNERGYSFKKGTKQRGTSLWEKTCTNKEKHKPKELEDSDDWDKGKTNKSKEIPDEPKKVKRFTDLKSSGTRSVIAHKHGPNFNFQKTLTPQMLEDSINSQGQATLETT